MNRALARSARLRNERRHRQALPGSLRDSVGKGCLSGDLDDIIRTVSVSVDTRHLSEKGDVRWCTYRN